MSERLTHTLRYVSAAGDGESRWIRLDQERTDETVSVDEAAELIDALYQVDACAKAASGSAASGGEVIDPPPQEDYDAIVPGFLGDLCDPEYWIAHVRILRSHQEPDYVLRSASAEILAVVRDIRETARDVFDDAGNSVDLSMPYAGGLVLPPGLRGSVRGSTLNLERPVGRLVVRYQTIYDRATLRVPVSKDAATGDGEEAARRAALDAAGLIAFQGDGATALAAAVALEPPPQDEETEAAELADMCRGKDKDKARPSGGCWERLAHYSLCACTGATAPDSEWEETAGADCPDGVKAGKYLGVRRVLDGYTGCPGEAEDVSDREFFKQTCCRYPYMHEALPLCRTSRQTYRGGAPIEGGADSWRERYGPDVTLTAVSPEDGNCGEEITRWRVERKNCCDDIIPLSPSPDNPEAFCPGETHDIGVRDGRPGDLRWRLGGGIVFLDGTTSRITSARSQRITTRGNVCPNPSVRVDDGCEALVMTFRCDDAEADAPTLSANDLVVGRGTRFSLTVSGGVPPFMWMAGGGIKYLGYSHDGATAFFETPDDDNWCTGDITATDQCGASDSATVRHSRGRWVRLYDYDLDDPPCKPYKLTTGYVSEPKCGYYIHVQTYSGQGNYETCRWAAGDVPAGSNVITEDRFAGDGGQTWKDNCLNASYASLYVPSYGDGCCVVKNKNTGNVSYRKFYVNRASRLYQWQC